MAEEEKSAHSSQNEVEFVTPPQSDDQESVKLDVGQLFYGDAFDKNEEMLSRLGAIKEELNLNFDEDGSDAVPLSNSDQEQDSHNSLSEPVETNLEQMYTLPDSDGDKSKDVRVFKFSALFLPDTDKRKKQMEMYNRKQMLDFPEFEDEAGRKRKRELKETYKKCLNMHSHKAKYLPVNPFLEDFYYLQGHSKNGVAPQQNKKSQVPHGYKLSSQGAKIDHHPNLEKIIPANRHRRPPPHTSNKFAGAGVHFGNHAARQATLSTQKQDTEANKHDRETDQNKKDFTLEACQINELKSRIVKLKSDPSTDQQLASDDLSDLHKRLKIAKVELNRTLDQKIPKMRNRAIEQQSFSLLNQLNKIYSQSGQSGGQQPQTKGLQFKFQKKLPSEVEIYEMQIDEKFRNANIATKRVKLWGELKDCISEHQMNKDSHIVKKQEWCQFIKNKQAFRQPFFRLIMPSENTAASSQEGGANQSAGKDLQGLQNKPLMGPGGVSKPGFPNFGAGLSRPLNPELSQGQNLNPQLGGATPSRAGRRPPPLVVDRSDFELVTSFEEYEKLKKQESMYYRQRKKTTVTAESIMRHVRWKMGKLSDKEFYREELAEMRREDQLEDKTKNHPQRQIHPQRRSASVLGGSGNASTTEVTDAEPKDMESAKKHRTVPIDFEENLDIHHDRKRVHIQEQILRRKSEKERASQQKQNTTQTPAYEPILAVGDHKESEEDHAGSENNNIHSDNESSSSDSDSDDSVDARQQNDAGQTMAHQIADELNHAECIKDLSFFKLKWDEKDLETFHRPNIQTPFLTYANQKMPVKVISTKKEDKETRLNPHEYFKTRFKLMLNKGKFCIFEHIDQHPLFVNNFGMASRLKRYYYGDKQPSKKEFLNQKNENMANRHIGPYGKFTLKGHLEKLDLLGQVDRSKYNGLTMLENNMYNAPVFYHRMPSTSNDFFCSMSRLQNDQRRIVIRSLNSFYTVGQIEPKREVYNPQSRHFTHFIKQQSKAYTTRLLQENKVMSFHDIRRYFDKIGSPILKKGLKEIEVDQDRNGFCRLSANFEMEKHKDRMTPEMICQYESARHGQYRLKKIGIEHILSADKISYSTHKFCFEETDLILQRVAKLIESEVLQTPWNLSSNYIKIKQEGSMMMLEGQGDPSYGHGGYSYLKMPLKISADSIQGAKANRMNLNPAIQNPKAVTGTEADLRKLKKLQLYEILHEAGVEETDLNQKTRWEMVAMLRCFASQQMPAALQSQGGQTMKSFYARGVRNTSKKQQEMYNKRANSTFRRQMETLSDPNPKDLHDLSEDEPDFTGLPELEAMGLELVGKGFATSLKKKEENKDGSQLVPTKRDPGECAKDFTRDIYILVNDDSRKQIVEVESMPDVKRIEDIKDYLKLLMVIHPNALSPQNQNPSGINIGVVSQTGPDFIYTMSGNGSKEWEKKLLEKLENREVLKNCEILCHKIRSSKRNDIEDPEASKDQQDKKYERVIFSADEKQIKKFQRCMKKNKDRTPRRTNRRNIAKTKLLTTENLKQKQAQDKIGSRKNGIFKSSKSISDISQSKKSNIFGAKSLTAERLGAHDTMNADDSQQQYHSQVTFGSNSRGIQGSGQKSKSKKRSSKPAPVAAQQPVLRFNITNNGLVPTAPPVVATISVQPLAGEVAQSVTYQPPPAPEPKPLRFNVTAGSDIPPIQPIAQGENMIAQQSMMAAQDPSNTMVSLIKLDTQQQMQAMPNSQPIVMNQGHQLSQMPAVIGEEDEDGDDDVDDHQEVLLIDDDEMIDDGNEEDKDEDQLDEGGIGSEQEESYYEDNEQISGYGDEESEFDQDQSGINQGMRRQSSGKQSYVYFNQPSMTRQKSKNSNRLKKQSSSVKFKNTGFSKEDFEIQNPTASKSRHRRQMEPVQNLNHIFMDIIDFLSIQPCAYWFVTPPSNRDAPNYRDRIKNPIALRDMKNRTKRNEYKGREMLLQDIQLMVENAATYNGPTNIVTQKAEEVQQMCKHQLQIRDGDIMTLETIITMDNL